MTTTDIVVISWLINAFVFGFLGALIAHRRNLEELYGFIYGFCLGIFGLIIMLLLRPGPPPPPKGMQSVRCPRCNVDQNAPEDATVLECWQCQQKITLTAKGA